MAGLVGYASSDDEEEAESLQQTVSVPKAPVTVPNTAEPRNQVKEQTTTTTTSDDRAASVASAAPPAGDQHAASKTKDDDSVTIGPVQQSSVLLGPSLPPVEEPIIDDQDTTGRPSSPYSANRALLRDLTLPAAPNMDIPPSPPGSPPPGANKKFDQFLELKKKGIHFNAKLEHSTALKNPSLMDKLMTFVEIDEQTQYSTTLPPDLWNPNAFPEWAFRSKLRKSRERLAKEKEAEKLIGGRTSVDFVPSTAANPAAISMPVDGGLSRGEKRKGGWN